MTTNGPLPPISSNCAFPAAWRRREPGLGRAGEGDGTGARVDRQLVADLGPGPRTKLNAPGGRSASTTHSASTPEHTAVDGAGVQTTGQPHASAGASTSAGIV